MKTKTITSGRNKDDMDFYETENYILQESILGLWTIYCKKGGKFKSIQSSYDFKFMMETLFKL